MKNDPISTLMQRRTVTIPADQTVQAAEAYLTEQGLSWAPVTGDRGELVGVISDADLRRFNAGGGDPSTPVWRQCTYRPITVGPETAVAAVAKLMVERHIHHVVVTVNGGIGGVVSSLDLVKLLF